MKIGYCHICDRYFVITENGVVIHFATAPLHCESTSGICPICEKTKGDLR